MCKIGGLTLQQINDLPRSEMIKHMRKFNHPEYLKGEFIPDDAEKNQYFIRFSVVYEKIFETYKVAAKNICDAKAKALRNVKESCNIKDVEILSCLNTTDGKYTVEVNILFDDSYHQMQFFAKNKEKAEQEAIKYAEKEFTDVEDICIFSVHRM